MVDENGVARADAPAVDHSHDIYTIANIITVLRLMLVPYCFSVLISGKSDVLAFALYAIAASTDWIDGQIARRTGTVTEIGKAIDPLVDRFLIASGVLGLYLAGRLPIWIALLLLARDAYMLYGAAFLVRNGAGKLPVVYIGKVTTAVLLAGFSGTILGWPMIPGLGLTDASWLPGLNAERVTIWIWMIYVGMVLSIITAAIYRVQASRALAAARARTEATA